MAGIRISRTRGHIKLVDPSEEAQSSVYGGVLRHVYPYDDRKCLEMARGSAGSS